MFELEIHKHAEKAFKKAPLRIKEKVLICLSHLREEGLNGLPYPIKPLQGLFRKYNYFEIKIDKDYRVIFRFEANVFCIRDAGTHNGLGTG